MKSNRFGKIISFILCLVMLISLFPLTAFASEFSLPSGTTMVSEVEQTLAPGITQQEIVYYDENNHKQRAFIAVADLGVDTVSVEASYYNDQGKEWGLQRLTEQAAAAEANHAGENYKVVAGINAAFFNTSTGQPNGAFAINGEICCSDSEGNRQPFFAVLKDGTAMIGQKGEWTKFKDQVVDAVHGYEMVVWNGENIYPYNPESTSQEHKVYPRTLIGVTADGKVVALQVDCGYGNYGLSVHHAAELMVQAGCVAAVRLDEGGSSTYIAREEGSDTLRVLNNPIDGAERTISNGVIFVSTAAASGVFDHAIVSSEYDYYAPYTSAAFKATGVDETNGEAPVPAEAVWVLTDDSLGTIDQNGVFVSNGAEGNVTVNLTCDDKVVGSKTISVVNPDSIAFSTDSTVLPYGKALPLEINASYGYYSVFVDGNCFDITSSEAEAGTINGLIFSAAGESAIESTVISAAYKYASIPNAKMTIAFGKGSDILYDFEDGDISNWLGNDEWNNGVYTQYSGTVSSAAWCDPNEGNIHAHTFLATAENGYVKNGEYSLGFTLDATQNTSSGGWGYTHLINLDIIDNYRILRDIANGNTGCRLGMWMYIPENAVFVCPRILWANSSNGGQTWARQHSKIMMATKTSDGVKYQEVAYDGMTDARIPECGWVYVYADISATDLAGYMHDITQSGRNNLYPAAVEFIVHSNNKFNENVTFFIDDITLDYGAIVSDRDMPVISDCKVNSGTTDVAALNGNTITANNAMFTAKIAENTTTSGVKNYTGLDYTTAQIYVDGNPVGTNASGSQMVSSEVILTNGIHDITFTIADKEGNLEKVTKQVNVAAANSTYPTITVTGRSSDGQTPKNGSVYWLDFTASDIEKISKVSGTVYLNGSNAFEYENTVTAAGFEFDAKFNEKTHLLDFSIEKTGNASASGSAVVASIPVRVWTNTVAIASGNNPVINIVYDVKTGTIEYTNAVNTASNFVGSFTSAKTSVATTIQGAGSASTYHTHSVAALDDQKATCTEAGYSGRTYCADCQSVIDWGTTTPATGHSYELVDGKLICSGCNETNNITGLFEMDGKYYYAIGGALQSGWVEIDGAWHYFGSDYAAVTGEYYYASRGITYQFDETGKTDGMWQTTKDGKRFWYGQWYYTARNEYQRNFVEIDGKTYNFDVNGYVTPGIHALYADWSAMQRGEMDVWEFDSDGALIRQITDKGIIDNQRGGLYLVEEDGYVHGGTAHVVKYNGDYYFVVYSGKLKQNSSQVITAANSGGLLEPGTYEFGADGKMIPPFTGVKAADDGTLYYYKNGGICSGVYNSELVKIDGEIYLVKWSGKVAANETRVITKSQTNDLIEPGTYEFDAEGKIVPPFTGVKADDAGTLYYYKNGGICSGVYNNEFVKIGEEIYFVKWSGKVAANETRVVVQSQTNGLIEPGTYEFDAEGKIVPPFTGVKAADDGTLYYYKNGGICSGVYNNEFVKIGEEIYFVKWSGKVAANETRVVVQSQTNGLIEPGTYEFDAEGKIVPPFTGVKAADDGILYYYKNGSICKEVYNSELVKINGEIYLVKWSGKVAANETRVVPATKTNDLLEPGTYVFDAEGKIVPPFTGIKADDTGTLYYYKNGGICKAVYDTELVEVNGDIYLVNWSGKVVANETRFVPGSKTNGLKPSGFYIFGIDGKLMEGLQNISKKA